MSLDRRLVFVALGDSLTRGFMPYDPSRPLGFGIPYTSYLDNLVLTGLSEKGLDAVARFVNLGVNGDTTRGMLWRFKTEVVPLEPDYVIVWGGINDLYGGAPPEEIMGNLKELYARVGEIGAEPIACTLTSVLGFDAAIQSIQALNDLIRAHCQKDGVPCADLFSATSDDEGRLLEPLSSDGAHLSRAGYERVASTIFSEVIEAILEKLPCESP